MPLHLVDHPLIQHKLGSLRSIETPSEQFRRLMGEVSLLLFIESTKNLTTQQEVVTAPFGETDAQKISPKLTIIPIMRAGLGMLDSIQNFWPDASVGHIGIYRDKFLSNTVEYYFKIPKTLENSVVYLLDPVIATGDTAIASVDRLKESGATDIRFVSILASSVGTKALLEAHPDVSIFTVSCQDNVTKEGYLSPGIGDIGARYYNTQ
ncbi:uracil phosphoribosyltransferase [Sessilibacter corallicola]|uniref:Uracil phosphoribosyltransferase n=1 Tax=Sessilibacter corallicola TaxID=2904075 RepID=A0ABQ0A4A6_9GAMM|nr:uracil phosphoribosyltransferase [Sessilibacter corallicola]MCE2026897.1 uracil phosphoribosyltransferase [Sessilibacter corallicola]